MAIIPNDEQFIGLSATVDTTERRSALVNAESQAYTMQDIVDTVSAEIPAPVNPTNNYIPYNNSGVFADSKLRQDATTRRIYNSYDLQISRQGFPSVLGLYQDANGGFGQVIPNQGIQWGYENADPMFGPEDYKDCSIINLPAPSGYTGSALAIKTQKFISTVPSFGDTQQIGIDVRPWFFDTATGGVTVYGGGANTNKDSYLNVIGDDGFPPSYKFTSSVAKFSGQMTGVVFPNVNNDTQMMIFGENGMVVYNTSINKLQVYSNGVWIDLH
jgi:hypothetical protein